MYDIVSAPMASFDDLRDSTSFGSMEYKDDDGVLRVSCILMGPLIMMCYYSSTLQSYYKKREVFFQAHNCPKKSKF